MLIKKKGRRRLTLELVLMTVVSLIAGVLAAQIVENMGLQYVLNKMADADYYEQQTKDCLERLQDYIGTSSSVSLRMTSRRSGKFFG